MSEFLRKVERQTKWQKARRTLPWPEKVRLAEELRESIRQLRATPFSQKSPDSRPEHGR